MLWSILLHSILVDGKKEFFKKSMSYFKERNIMYVCSNIARAS